MSMHMYGGWAGSPFLLNHMRIIFKISLEARGVSSSEDEGQEMVNISLYSTSPEIMHSFPATEIKDKAQFHR